MTKLYAPADHTCFSVEGVQYDVAEDGTFEVENPVHVPVLVGLGCSEEPAVVTVSEPEPVVTKPDFEGMTKAVLAAWLEEHGLTYETDANKVRLVALCEEAWAEMFAPAEEPAQ